MSGEGQLQIQIATHLHLHFPVKYHQSLAYLIYLLVIWTGASIITIALCLVKCYNQKRFLASKCITGVCDQAHPGSVGGGAYSAPKTF